MKKSHRPGLFNAGGVKRASAARGGAGDAPADPLQAFVFFDVENEDAGLRDMLASSVFVTGAPVAGLDKGAGYNGGLWRAAPRGDGYFGVVVASAISLRDIGLSLIQGTVSPGGVGGDARTTPILGGDPTAQPYRFSSPLQFDLEVRRNGLIADILWPYEICTRVILNVV